MSREPVYSVTSARSGKRDEISGRERRYAIAMALRSACFVGGVIAWQALDARLGAILFVGAIVLPYTSVILANAGVRKHATGDDLLTHPGSNHGSQPNAGGVALEVGQSAIPGLPRVATREQSDVSDVVGSA